MISQLWLISVWLIKHIDLFIKKTIHGVAAVNKPSRFSLRSWLGSAERCLHEKDEERAPREQCVGCVVRDEEDYRVQGKVGSN